jgi:hypothetical protein
MGDGYWVVEVIVIEGQELTEQMYVIYEKQLNE